MRPRTLEEIVGQDHIVGPGRLLRRAIQADRLSSVIFYGPPGTGKTSLARVIANTTRAAFESLNAVLSGIKDIREAIDRADERLRLYSRRTILFVDEVHRWNKAQQDALLPWVENGTVILIGATTENPFFEVNRALVSRSRIFQLKALGPAELMETARRTLADRERGYGTWQVRFGEGALEHLVQVAGGDARSLLNALELAIETSVPWPPPENAEIRVTMEAAEESIQRRAVLYDRDGDYHFDTISAFIKSVRGSDPDAALYWLAKMVRAGEDPAFIFRRMIILASEDVGLADPQALRVVIACAEAFDRIGFPEGNFPLAHACLYLATAPKSNTTMSFFDAMAEVEKEDAEVPKHLRDASRDAESFGHGEGYIYPHAYRDHWAAQQYLPSVLRGKTFYIPSSVGHEGRIRDEVLRKREIQASVIMGAMQDDAEEFLSWSADSRGREGWFKRLESERGRLLIADRDAILGLAVIKRHDRSLIAAAGDGLLLWECLRRSPEGLCAALVDSDAARDTLLRYARTLDEPEQPLLAAAGELPSPAQAEAWFSCSAFDHIFAREPWKRNPGGNSPRDPVAAFASFGDRAVKLLAGGGDLGLLASPPLMGNRISRILREECGGEEPLTGRLEEAEDGFYRSSGWWAWDREDLERALREAGFSLESSLMDQEEERYITERDVEAWFNRDRSSWGAFIGKSMDGEDFSRIKSLLLERIKDGPVRWKWKSCLVRGTV
jgi:putative ATPase